MNDKLTEAEVQHLDAGRCPDCKNTKFLEGPHGGMSVNIMCGVCGAKFNVVPGMSGSFGKERLSDPDPQNLPDSAPPKKKFNMGKTVPLLDVLTVASNAPLASIGLPNVSRYDRYMLCTNNARAFLQVGIIGSIHTGEAQCKANAMLLPHCRNHFMALHGALDRLNRFTVRLTLMAPGTITQQDWEDLKALNEECAACLTIASQVAVPQ